ncbi:MAG: hypothetical protein QF393_20635 [Rhodospirillales bacterium]|jgi:hypothetical protein|nr:hypothetical protein [Rhodospirillales bacterium]
MNHKFRPPRFALAVALAVTLPACSLHIFPVPLNDHMTPGNYLDEAVYRRYLGDQPEAAVKKMILTRHPRGSIISALKDGLTSLGATCPASKSAPGVTCSYFQYSQFGFSTFGIQDVIRTNEYLFSIQVITSDDKIDDVIVKFTKTIQYDGPFKAVLKPTQTKEK